MRAHRFEHMAGASALAAALGLIAGGCKATHVAYVHTASLGIDISAASEGTTKLALGFDRETFAIVPRFSIKNGKEVTDDSANAMSVAAISRVYAEGLREVQFGHVVATGASAQALAVNPGALKDLAEQVFIEEPERKRAETEHVQEQAKQEDPS